MEKVPGASLADAWSEIDMETKSKMTRSVVGYVRQLRDLRGCFTGIGTLYFREEIDAFNAAVCVLPVEDEKYDLGPLVTPYIFVGGRKLHVPGDLGPYSNDAEYMAALAASELEDMKLLLSPDAPLHSNFDGDLAGDADKNIQVLDKLQPILSALFSSQPRNFALHHHDLSLRNILVDSAAHQITGIVDWECVGTRPHWEDTYPQFLLGPEITEAKEPLAPGDTDPLRVECWENWEKVKLRLVFDKELRHDDDGRDEIRRGFRMPLDIVEISPKMAQKWMKEYGNCHNDTPCRDPACTTVVHRESSTNNPDDNSDGELSLQIQKTILANIRLYRYFPAMILRRATTETETQGKHSTIKQRKLVLNTAQTIILSEVLAPRVGLSSQVFKTVKPSTTAAKRKDWDMDEQVDGSAYGLLRVTSPKFISSSLGSGQGFSSAELC